MRTEAERTAALQHSAQEGQGGKRSNEGSNGGGEGREGGQKVAGTRAAGRARERQQARHGSGVDRPPTAGIHTAAGPRVLAPFASSALP
jgi:hypothetical protein